MKAKRYNIRYGIKLGDTYFHSIGYNWIFTIEWRVKLNFTTHEKYFTFKELKAKVRYVIDCKFIEEFNNAEIIAIKNKKLIRTEHTIKSLIEMIEREIIIEKIKGQ